MAYIHLGGVRHGGPFFWPFHNGVRHGGVVYWPFSADRLQAAGLDAEHHTGICQRSGNTRWCSPGPFLEPDPDAIDCRQGSSPSSDC